MSNIHMVMLDRSMDAKQKSKMFDEIDSVKGVMDDQYEFVD